MHALFAAAACRYTMCSGGEAKGGKKECRQGERAAEERQEKDSWYFNHVGCLRCNYLKPGSICLVPLRFHLVWLAGTKGRTQSVTQTAPALVQCLLCTVIIPLLQFNGTTRCGVNRHPLHICSASCPAILNTWPDCVLLFYVCVWLQEQHSRRCLYQAVLQRFLHWHSEEDSQERQVFLWPIPGYQRETREENQQCLERHGWRGTDYLSVNNDCIGYAFSLSTRLMWTYGLRPLRVTFWHCRYLHLVFWRAGRQDSNPRDAVPDMEPIPS